MNALKTVTYLLNMVPIEAVRKTHYKLWIGRKRILRHFHVWGCPGEIKTYNRHERKFDAKTNTSYFIDYFEKSKRYRFYYPNYSMRIAEFDNDRFIENCQVVRAKSGHSRNIGRNFFGQDFFLYCCPSCCITLK